MKEVIENYKSQIETIDKEFIYMLSRRFELIKQIKEIDGNYLDKNNNLTNFDNLFVEGIYRGIDKNFIKNIWKIIENEELSLKKASIYF